MLKDQNNILHEGILSDYANSEVVIFGIPFDGTVSYRPGTRFGPQMVRNELDGLETYSPYLNLDMTDYALCDLGDISLPYGNTDTVLNIVEEQVDAILKDGKKTLAIGGEHLITYPLVKSYIKKYSDMHVIHLDAHADLREDYLGQRFSHATVIRRVYDHLTTGQIWQHGIRSGTREEFMFANKHTNMSKFNLEGIERIVKLIGDSPVYLTIDLDVLDPSIFSGTGTPEPGGVTFNELINALNKLKGLNLIGGDIVELSPHYDTSGISTIVACKVLRELALLLSTNK